MKQANRDTERLGGVDVPSADRLREMHGSPYILHARGGELKEVPAEKVLLPRETNTSPQSVDLKRAPDGTLYSRRRHTICKSTDSGRSWSAHGKAEGLGLFELLPGGALVGLSTEGGDPARVIVCRSEDEGRTIETVSAIDNPPGCSGGACWIHRLPDGTLLAGVGRSDHVFEEQGDGRLVLISGSGVQFAYRSGDEGLTWSHPARVHDWFSEGGVTLTPSGRLLAAIRYQRPTLPGDPADLEQRNRGMAGWPYKHVCLVDSDDGGRSWTNPRLLVTRFGQTRGHPVALGDNSVLVVHDTRYGPGPPGSRGMVSRDGGRTWEDEVYYLDATNFTGSYAASAAPEDGTIVTVAGSSEGRTWDDVRDATDFYAIRWTLQ